MVVVGCFLSMQHAVLFGRGYTKLLWLPRTRIQVLPWYHHDGYDHSASLLYIQYYEILCHDIYTYGSDSYVVCVELVVLLIKIDCTDS
jgi:hypothetical protein